MILWFEIKLTLEPDATSLIAPVWVMPVFAPAAALLAVTVILVPPELMVMAPKDTIVVDAPPVAVTVRLLAVMRPVAVIGVAVAVEVDCVLVKVTAPPLMTPVSSIPAAVVVVVVMVIAWPVAVILPVL